MVSRLWPEALWKEIVFSGGVACRLEVLREIVQKRFAARGWFAPLTEDTLLGLLNLALVFSGNVASVKKASQQVRSLYQPSEGPHTIAGLQYGKQ